MERTLSIIKPDAVKKQVIGKILDRFESNGLRIAALKKLQLSKEQAQKFYEIHKDRPFYNDLVNFMISGPVVVCRKHRRKCSSRKRQLRKCENRNRILFQG